MGEIENSGTQAVETPGNVVTDKSRHGDVSIVVPFYNEEDSLAELAAEIRQTMTALNTDYEIIFVDDGSTDRGAGVVRKLCASNPQVRLIRFNRNFGKAAALSAGLAHARGQVIITMDGDLQDDPNEIGRMLDEIDNGYDVISGWKKKRLDPLDKTFPSRIFNWLVRVTFQLDLHDINCGFKAYTREAAKSLHLYGELHRFTPALLHGLGFTVKELPVNHRPRRYGSSKYGITRLVKGLFDIVTVFLLTRFNARPLHFFGGIAILLGGVGMLILVYLTIIWFLGMGPIGNRPLLFFGILLFTTAMQFISVGLIAELIQKTQISEESKYIIRERVGFSDRETA